MRRLGQFTWQRYPRGAKATSYVFARFQRCASSMLGRLIHSISCNCGQERRYRVSCKETSKGLFDSRYIYGSIYIYFQRETGVCRAAPGG